MDHIAVTNSLHMSDFNRLLPQIEFGDPVRDKWTFLFAFGGQASKKLLVRGT